MEEWIKPLPFETGVSTLIGAVLSFTFSQQRAVSHLASWKEIPGVIGFFALIILYILLMNLFCKGLYLKRYGVVAWTGPGLISVLVAAAAAWSAGMASPGDSIVFTPDKYVVFTSSLLILWLTFSVLSALVLLRVEK